MRETSEADRESGREHGAAIESPLQMEETEELDANDQEKAGQLAQSQIQMRFGGGADTDQVHAAAEEGIRETPTAMPHGDRIQRSFGHHPVSDIRAHIGGRAGAASQAMGAEAFATGSHVGFRAAPDLHTAAHEAAHVVQQRGGVQLRGGVGESGDGYEQHADAVADRVVAGGSAEGMLDGIAASGGAATGAVQKKGTPPPRPTTPHGPAPTPGSLGFAPPALPTKQHGPAPTPGSLGLAPPALPTKQHGPAPTPGSLGLAPPALPTKQHGPAPTRASLGLDPEPTAPEPEAEQDLAEGSSPEKKKAKIEIIEEVGKDEQKKPASEEVKTTKKVVAKAKVTNLEAKDRIQKGAAAVGDLGNNVKGHVAPVSTSGSGFAKIFSGLKSFFSGIQKIFSSQSEDEEQDDSTQATAKPDAPSPVTNKSQAVSELADLKTKLEKRVPVLEKASSSIADQVLPAAHSDCKETADKIESVVAARWHRHLLHIGFGIGLGFRHMAQEALADKDIRFDDFKGARLRAGLGGMSSVSRVSYLGMAPMVYKKDKGGKGEKEVIRKEAEVMGKLGHDNIIRVGGRADINDVPGFVMEDAQYGTLSSIFKAMKEQRYGDSDRLLMMRYLMRGGFRGLAEVHKNKLVHADIKGDNLLLGRNLETKVADFGLTGPVTDDEDKRQKGGTDEFMAPEVKVSGAEQASDVWAMAETMMIGFLGMDSFDIASGKKSKTMSKGYWRGVNQKFTDNSWHDKLAGQVKKFKGSSMFVDFIKKATTFSTKDRLTAQQCLQEEFLKLEGGDEAKAKKLVTDLLKPP